MKANKQTLLQVKIKANQDVSSIQEAPTSLLLYEVSVVPLVDVKLP
jgi:hypothetical protein